MKIDNNKQSNCVFEVTFKLRLHGQNYVIYRTDSLNGTVCQRLTNSIGLKLTFLNFVPQQ